jgi:DNA-binding NtrC family response regulator
MNQNELPQRDTIHLMADAFQPEQLQALIACLEADGYRCAVFQGLESINAVISDSRCQLILTGVNNSELPHLIKAIRASSNRIPTVPIILYFKGLVTRMRDLFVPEFDDFFFEPLNIQSVRLRVNRLLHHLAYDQDQIAPIKQHLISYFGMNQFVGQAPNFVETIKQIPRVANCNAPVLLMGDTGTGKEMCARAVHYLSPRASLPFIAVNCGSIPTELFENEMFGHDPGAYTDARESRRGLVAEAEGGTLFLDEVNSLALASQAKLLRFLQDQQYRPLGATRYRQANVRVLAASNKDLLDKSPANLFREDLYYRLKVVLLTLPSLRERLEDIMPLASHFLTTASREYGRHVTRFSHDATLKLNSYNWPGNIRELENVVRQAVVFAEGTLIRADDLQISSGIQDVSPAVVSNSPSHKEPFKVAKAQVIESFERSYLKNLLNECGGNISKAARGAQKDRRAFFALLKKYDMTSGSRTAFLSLSFLSELGVLSQAPLPF